MGLNKRMALMNRLTKHMSHEEILEEVVQTMSDEEAKATFTYIARHHDISMKPRRKSMEELLIQNENLGYVTHYCPYCDEETYPVEIDSGRAWCEYCNEQVEVPKVL